MTKCCQRVSQTQQMHRLIANQRPESRRDDCQAEVCHGGDVSRRWWGFDVLRLQSREKRQIAISVVIVEPVADYKDIGNLESNIIRHQRHALFPLLEHQDSRANRSWPQVL